MESRLKNYCAPAAAWGAVELALERRAWRNRLGVPSLDPLADEVQAILDALLDGAPAYSEAVN